MARFDKYNPHVGGFRAILNAAVLTANVGKMYAVSLNGSGKVVVGGAAATDLVGVICPVRTHAAGEPIDVMTSGEIVEALETAGTALVAGALIYGHTDGTVDDTATAGHIFGRMAEATRAIVRIAT